MAKAKKSQDDQNQNDEQQNQTTSEDVTECVFHPSEKEVVTNGVVYLEWTDEVGCTFKKVKPL